MIDSWMVEIGTEDGMGKLEELLSKPCSGTFEVREVDGRLLAIVNVRL